MTAFSRENSKKRAIEIKIRRAKTQARGGHPDLTIKHPDWKRDAAKSNYTMLIKTITEDTQKEQIRNEKFRSKLHAPAK